MHTLRTLLHLLTEFQLESYTFPVGPDGVPVTTLAGFWSQISRPAIRFILRALSATIYVGGETWIRPLDQDLQLLYHILRLDAQVHDLTYYLVEHWVGLQKGRGTLEVFTEASMFLL